MILILVLVLILLILVLFVVASALLVLILLILVPVLVIVTSASAALLLLLKFLLGVDVVLLGVHIGGIPQEGLLESVDGSLPVFLGYGDIALVVVIVRSVR